MRLDDRFEKFLLTGKLWIFILLIIFCICGSALSDIHKTFFREGKDPFDCRSKDLGQIH
jgi:hypothetical protein